MIKRTKRPSRVNMIYIFLRTPLKLSEVHFERDNLTIDAFKNPTIASVNRLLNLGYKPNHYHLTCDYYPPNECFFGIHRNEND